MRKLILLGEGDFGPALLDSAMQLTGIEPDDETFAIEGKNEQTIRSTMDSICNTVHRQDSLVVLCDAAMSQAMQEVWLVLEKRGMISRMILIGGANVPAVVAAMRFKDEIEDDQALSQTITAEGRAGLTPYDL